MSNRTTDLNILRRDVLNAEMVVIDLNRQLTGAMVTSRPTGTLSSELDAVIEARNVMRQRLSRLEGQEPSLNWHHS
jgi:hypothetical protein